MARRKPKPYEVVRWMRVKDRERLKRLRLRKDLTQRELGLLAKVSHTTIWHLENGTMRTLTEKVALAIAKRLDCDWEDLFESQESVRVSGVANAARSISQDAVA